MRKLDYNLIVSTRKGRSKIASLLTLLAISLSTMVVVVALCVTNGFKAEISSEVVKLLDYMHITQQPSIFIRSDEVVLEDYQIEDIQQIIAPQPLKAGVEAYAVLQNGENVVPSSMIAEVKISDGNNPLRSSIDDSKIIISKSAAKLLEIEVGANLDVVYFVGEQAKLKSLEVDSIYSSQVVDIEKVRAYVSIANAREFSSLDSTYYNYYSVAERFDTEQLDIYLDEEMLMGESVEERAPQLFGWLNMIMQNFTLVLIIMIIVAVINVLTSTLIVILDNTAKIALFRSLGMSKKEVSKLYVAKIFRSGVYGVLLGASLGLLLCVIQSIFEVITLDATTYLVSSVPMDFDWIAILLTMLVMLLFVFLAIVLPVRIISKMSISKALKYE